MKASQRLKMPHGILLHFHHFLEDSSLSSLLFRFFTSSLCITSKRSQVKNKKRPSRYQKPNLFPFSSLSSLKKFIITSKNQKGLRKRLTDDIGKKSGESDEHPRKTASMIPKSEKNILHFEKHEVKNSTSKPPSTASKRRKHSSL